MPASVASELFASLKIWPSSRCYVGEMLAVGGHVRKAHQELEVLLAKAGFWVSGVQIQDSEKLVQCGDRDRGQGMDP